ncbi:putative transcriptional regulator protein, MarR family [Pseudorhizobium banfieldiae]|uniref:Putative transcriptional regulator protein, MarR family n=1 Tax=Pseudorhizobium banfieldiae TaxID=1125847 RepID=L0NF10_9HYPH|nr:MarR family transcriptional regulator [Pseudorhizobium banfieldiae]CAD6610258.1 MarR family transcriptional regulator [arsenite-oxidising bacterium NT-25]CCF19640.1 putative transcriptional regulator protein, MarR family [Pseudorhizobium banfieldiae]
MNKDQSLPWDHPRFKSWIAVARACQLMQSALARDLSPLDIKPPHLDILVNLFRFEGISQQELAHKLLVGRSNVSMTLPQLERRGLIERRGDKRDKRVLRLFLTKEGRRVTEEGMRIQTALINSILSATPIEECLAIGANMERVVAALQSEMGDDQGDG